MAKYLVVIALGSSRDYGPKQGWDTLWGSRPDAEDCARRANAQEGWTAKVVEVSEEHSEIPFTYA